MTSLTPLETGFNGAIRNYADRVNKLFSSTNFQLQQDAWSEREDMLEYFRKNPPANESIASSHFEEEVWLADKCVDCWRIGEELIDIIDSEKIEMVNDIFWQVIYKIQIENYIFLAIVKYFKTKDPQIRTHFIKIN